MSMCRCEECGNFFDTDYDFEGFSSGREICENCYGNLAKA
jgi:formylmethanofuran dehydrogenase subunit E